jgi:hypothetical protein
MPAFADDSVIVACHAPLPLRRAMMWRHLAMLLVAG